MRLLHKVTDDMSAVQLLINTSRLHSDSLYIKNSLKSSGVLSNLASKYILFGICRFNNIINNNTSTAMSTAIILLIIVSV